MDRLPIRTWSTNYVHSCSIDDSMTADARNYVPDDAIPADEVELISTPDDASRARELRPSASSGVQPDCPAARLLPLSGDIGGSAIHPRGNAFHHLLDLG
jgi:hypothetical protein